MPWNILQFKYLQLWYHWNTLTLLSELSEKGDCIQIASVWGLRFSRQWELRCCSISDGDRMFIRNVGYPPVSLHGVTTQNNVVQLLLCETADWNSCCGKYIWERFGLTTLYLPPGFLHVNIFFYNFLITLWVASLLILQPNLPFMLQEELVADLKNERSALWDIETLFARQMPLIWISFPFSEINTWYYQIQSQSGQGLILKIKSSPQAT